MRADFNRTVCAIAHYSQLLVIRMEPWLGWQGRWHKGQMWSLMSPPSPQLLAQTSLSQTPTLKILTHPFSISITPWHFLSLFLASIFLVSTYHLHTWGLMQVWLLPWIAELILSLHLCFTREIWWVSGVRSWIHSPANLPPPLPIPRIGAPLPKPPIQVLSTSAFDLGGILGAGTQRIR